MKVKIGKGFQGIAFGVVDGVVLALGVVTGLSVLENKTTIFFSLLATGMADAFGNAAGMHVEEETEKEHSRKEVWTTTIFTFLGTLCVFALLTVPILILPLRSAVSLSWVLGISLLMALGFIVADFRGWDKRKVSIEYALWGIAASVFSYILVSLAKSLVG